jgi:hypothetical protein
MSFLPKNLLKYGTFRQPRMYGNCSNSNAILPAGEQQRGARVAISLILKEKLIGI